MKARATALTLSFLLLAAPTVFAQGRRGQGMTNRPMVTPARPTVMTNPPMAGQPVLQRSIRARNATAPNNTLRAGAAAHLRARNATAPNNIAGLQHRSTMAATHRHHRRHHRHH